MTIYKRPNMCHIFENEMTPGYQIRWWRMIWRWWQWQTHTQRQRQWKIRNDLRTQHVTSITMMADEPRVIHRSCWCAGTPILLMRWSTRCADADDALMLMMYQPCWCLDPADALLLMMHWCTLIVTKSQKNHHVHPIIPYVHIHFNVRRAGVI